MNRYLKLTLTTTYGEVLDSFLVTDHYNQEADVDDEAVGSYAAESLLLDRVRRALEHVPCPRRRKSVTRGRAGHRTNETNSAYVVAAQADHGQYPEVL